MSSEGKAHPQISVQYHRISKKQERFLKTHDADNLKIVWVVETSERKMEAMPEFKALARDIFREISPCILSFAYHCNIDYLLFL